MIGAVLRVGVVAVKELISAFGGRRVVGDRDYAAAAPPAFHPIVLTFDVARRVTFARFKVDREDRVGLPGQNGHNAENKQ